MLKHLDLFSGIGGFALATEMVWGEVEHTFCDNEPFSQAIIKKHWPNSIIHGDIKTLIPPPADLVTGGFPCQPFSSAGDRRGTEDDRHLWPEMLRAIRLSAPKWVVGENVSGLLTWNGGLVLDQVCTDLEAEGYEVWPFIIPASAVGAPHRRDRVWIVAHSNRGNAGRDAGELPRSSEEERLQKQQPVGESGSTNTIRLSANSKRVRRGKGRGHPLDTPQGQASSAHQQDNWNDLWGSPSGRFNVSNAHGERLEESPAEKGKSRLQQVQRGFLYEEWPEAAARLCLVDDGLPGGLVRPRGWRNAAIKGAGNAIVPQVAAQIMQAIKEVDPTML